MKGKQILLAALALLAAGAFWPSPAAAQFGFPGGIRIPVPMFAPPGYYNGNRGYRHSGGGAVSSRHRSHDEDSNPSGEVSKDDLSKVDVKNKAVVDKAAVDKGAATLDKPAADKAAIETGNVTAVNSEAAPKPALDATRTAEANPALYEHGPDLTPER